ncbi:MAG: DUF4105 domain-containing protein [Rudaea sp.]
MRDRARRRGFFAALILLLISPIVAHAQTAQADGANLDVSLITFGPGTEVWERFGHNAILIHDRADTTSVLYNYGIFDFDQKDFFLNFARGRMIYRMAADDPNDELPSYREEGRWIVEQDLNLEPAQRAELAGYLAWNARPENAEYRYEYFTANCSTRVRDALDKAVGGAIRQQTIAPSRGFTYRMDTLRLMWPDTLLAIGMDAGLGPFADRRLSYWDESFLPTELMRHMREVYRVDSATGARIPLVAKEVRLADARLAEPDEYPPNWFWRAVAAGIVVALLIIVLSRWRAKVSARFAFASIATISALILGIGGLVLIGLWTLTEHISAWHNENILLFDPLCLLLIPTWLGAFRARWVPTSFARGVGLVIALLAGVALFVKVFPAFPQDNRFWLALLVPIHAAFAGVLYLARPRTA